MQFLMSPPIIRPRKRLSTSRTSVRPPPKMAILMSLQVCQSRESLGTHITLEPRILGRLATQLSELRRQIGFLGVVILDMLLLVLVRREAEGNQGAALDGTQEGPVVPRQVPVPRLFDFPPLVEIDAAHPVALEKLLAVPLFEHLAHVGSLRAGFGERLNPGADLVQGVAEFLDADLVALFRRQLLVAVDMRPDVHEWLVEVVGLECLALFFRYFGVEKLPGLLVIGDGQATLESLSEVSEGLGHLVPISLPLFSVVEDGRVFGV